MRVRFSPLRLMLLCGILGCGVAAVLPASADEAALAARRTVGIVVPAGTHVRFHLDTALSSAESKTGERFSFTVLEPIAVGSRVLVAAGAHGAGTVVLAGHAGTGGHEGDLTLRLDTAGTVDGNQLAFADQRLEINGRNRKVGSSLLGFVPWVGMGAMFIRGNESRVAPDRMIETVLKRAATVDAASAGDGASASPAPSPAPVRPNP